jgi:hypothetical protein
MFPQKGQQSAKGGASRGAPAGQLQPPGPGLHQALLRPQGVKAGQTMDPMEAMMGGMGDLSQFAPPPPAPAAPLGPDGLPVGGAPASTDPGMDPAMGGSSLFQALNMGLDPFASPPDGHGDLDPPPSLNTLLAMLALQNSGVAGMNPSGVMPDPTRPGEAQGLQQFSAIQ